MFRRGSELVVVLCHPAPRLGVTMQEGQALRRFTQSEDSFVTYADFVQVTRTANEVYIQFYTTVPGIPLESAKIADVVSRLSATIVVSPQQAKRIAEALTKGEKS